MKSYTNYRYRDFCNESFKNEFRDDSSDHFRDFSGSRIKSCDFRGANLVGADFSETAIARDKKNFRNQLILMFLHIILGAAIGYVSWSDAQRVSAGCGKAINGYGQAASVYGWIENTHVWLFAFSTAAVVSQKWLFCAYAGPIWVMTVIITVTNMNLVGGIGGMIALFMLSLFGLYLVYKECSIFSQKRLLYVYMGLIGAMILIATIDLKLVGGMALLIAPLVGLVQSLLGVYLGYRKGSIAVGMVWMTVGASSTISAGTSWFSYHKIPDAILFAVLAIFPVMLAIRAFNLHFTKVKMSSMTSICGADLENARFISSHLENCDFSDANVKGVDWYGATFKNCKFPKGFSMDVN